MPVIAIDDTLAEGTETIILALAPGAYSASPIPAVLHLIDNETPAPVVQFAQASATVQENAGTVNIPVTLTGTLTSAATVEYFIGGGTSFGSGVDFSFGSGTLTFHPGDTAQTIPLTIIEDAVREGSERVVIKLRNANGASLGALSEFTCILADNDTLNLLGYAQNLGPETAAAAPVPGSEPGFITLTYRRNLAAVDVVFVIEQAANLTDANPWSTASVVEEIVSDDGATRVIKAKVASAGAQYLRLRVEQY